VKHVEGNTNSPELFLLCFLPLAYHQANSGYHLGFHIFSRWAAHFFTAGLFWINSTKEFLWPAKKNMCCVTQHPEVVDNYFAEEISYHCVVGPSNPQLIHISRFGVILKHHQPNKW